METQRGEVDELGPLGMVCHSNSVFLGGLPGGGKRGADGIPVRQILVIASVRGRMF